MKHRAEVERVNQELVLTKASLAKETEWKMQLEQNYKKILQEKRSMLGQ